MDIRVHRLRKMIFSIIVSFLFIAFTSPVITFAQSNPAQTTSPHATVDKTNPYIEIASPYNNGIVDAIPIEVDVNYSSGLTYKVLRITMKVIVL